MGNANEKLTNEELGNDPKLSESDKEQEIQDLVDETMKFMDDHPDITEVHVCVAKPYSKFLQTMFPGIENVAGGIISSSVNSFHIQIKQPVGFPRCAFMRQKLFRCDIDIVFTDTPGFSVFLLPLHDKSLKKKEPEDTKSLVNEDGSTPFFGDNDAGTPQRLGVSMTYDLTRPYKAQIVEFQEEALNLIQQFCTLQGEAGPTDE